MHPLTGKDVNVFSQWLDKEYIYRWFCPEGEGQRQEWLNEVQNVGGKYNHFKQFMVYCDNAPIGYCFCMDIYYEPEYLEETYGMTVEANSVYEIGYLIGEETWLRKGLGKIIIKKLEEKIREIGGTEILADPDPENIPSIKALLSNGFIKIKDGAYRKKLNEHQNLYRPLRIGSLMLEGNLLLAPVAGYSGRSFRSLCVEQGACFAFTELVSAEALYRNPGHYGLASEPAGDGKKILPAALSLVSRAPNERHYAVQLFGGEPEPLYKAARLLAPLRPDAVDINAGCPVPKVVKNGAGSALMKDPAKLGRVVEAVVRASRETLGEVPVTVKMRSGWDFNSINYAECARVAVEAGAAMVSLHPRTRSQNYGGTSNWPHIADLVSRLPVPVAGSGDLYTPEDAQRMLRETGCAAVMFARGAMGNPFIFSAARSLLETGTWEPAPLSERMTAAFRHLELLAADIGEHTACLEMRKQFCAYTKGLRGGAAVREQAVHAETIADYRRILDTFTLNPYA